MRFFDYDYDYEHAHEHEKGDARVVRASPCVVDALY